MENIKKTFADYFKHWELELPKDVPAKGKVQKAGWLVRYVIITNEGGERCLDFPAHHRMTNTRHCRIHPDGHLSGLESYREFFSYDPDIPGIRLNKSKPIMSITGTFLKSLNVKDWSKIITK